MGEIKGYNFKQSIEASFMIFEQTFHIVKLGKFSSVILFQHSAGSFEII